MFGKSPQFPQKQIISSGLFQWKGIVAKAVFLLKGSPHKNYFAEISTSHVVFFQSRNDLRNYRCLRVFTFVKVSWRASPGPVGENYLPMGDRLDPWSRKITCHMPGGTNQSKSTSAEPTCSNSWIRCTYIQHVLLTEREPARSEEDSAQSRRRTTKPPLVFKKQSHRHSSHRPSGRVLVRIMADPRLDL